MPGLDVQSLSLRRVACLGAGRPYGCMYTICHCGVQLVVISSCTAGPVNPGLGPAPPRGLLDRGQPPPLAGLPGLGVQAIARGGAAPNLPLGGQV